MATQTGINARVKIGTTTILDMATWTVTDTKEAISAPVFGETFNKVHGMGIRNVSGTVSGYLNTADTTGQNNLESHFASGGAISDFRLYFNTTEYYQGTEVYITSYDSNATSEDSVIPVTFNFVASENWARTSD